MKKPTSEQLAEFFGTWKTKLSKCLEPEMQCDGSPIRAHSVQNARILDLLQASGHVIAPSIRFGVDGPQITFDSIGRNNATTFTGLCSVHDANIFAPIDNAAFDKRNEQQLFLFAYRAVTRELHTCMEGAVRIQLGYKSRVDRGIDPKDVPSAAGQLATEHLIKAFLTYQYREKYFDEPLMAKNYGTLTHDVLTFENQSPVIAVSSLFSLGWNEMKDDVTCVALNVFPTDDKHTSVIFSYAQPDRTPARAALDRILTSSGDYQKYELSKTILHHCENFVLNPKWFNAWSNKKVKAIHDAFCASLSGENIKDDPDLMLF